MYKTLNLSEKIKLIITDFDGVFTDGGVFIGENSVPFKKVNFRDLMGVSVAIKSGYNVAFVSGEKTAAIDLIAQKFNLEDIHQNIRIKKDVVESLLKKYNLAPDEVIYIGDDINDIDSMKLVEYKIAPADAHRKVKNIEGVQLTEAFGGNGVFREVIDNLLELKTNA